MRYLTKLLTIVCCFVFASLVFAQLEEQVEVRLMEVWVKVTDKHDQPVTDLQMNDFELFIDGNKTELRCFDHTRAESVNRSMVDSEIAPSSKSARKYFFYFDLLNTLP